MSGSTVFISTLKITSCVLQKLMAIFAISQKGAALMKLK